MSTNPYNDPFYFALPRGQQYATVGEAVQHIENRYGLRGTAKVERIESSHTLYSLRDCTYAAPKQVTA